MNDFWARAAAQLSDDERRNINFSRPDKLNILAELHAEAEQARQRCVKSRWKYTRKSGETVIIRDVFDKMVRWIDMFKQIGDIAVQYDPVHASLPWAGIRLVLQIAVNDTNKFASVIEGLAQIAQLICRYAVIETLYLQGTTNAIEELEKALVWLYASILSYLSKAKQYLEQGTTKRVLKSAISAETQFEPDLSNIRTAQYDVDRCMALVDRSDKIDDHAQLVRLLGSIDAPLRRMNDDLTNLHDDLQAPKRAVILQWLSPEPYIQHHRQATQGVLAGTGQWLLSDPVFKEWKNESASSILWLHGIPGSGKSKLVSIVIEDAWRTFRAGDSPQPVFFYCSRNPAEPARSDPEAILASLARQLSCLEPGRPLMRPTVNLFKKKEEEGFASGSLQLDDSRTLILQLIKQYPLTTIIIDAVDECDPQKRREFLRILEQILQNASSLVKMFISSRNDQDIVLLLKDYPNLEIDSRKNSNDIARFVEDQTKQLIKNGDLLQYSTSPADMEELIVSKVVEGAGGMFRWASMQLQYLCSFDVDDDIKNNLGRLPPDLYTLYTEIYTFLSRRPGEIQATIFSNALHWLLCAGRSLNTEEFLCAVSLNTKSRNPASLVSKDLVLKTCNNFVIFDSQLDTFRFAHLSVREFLEQRPDYSPSHTNALAAEICLWTILSTNGNLAAENSLPPRRSPGNITPAMIQKLSKYADMYWPVHCQAAGDSRKSGRVNMALAHVTSEDSNEPCWLEHWHDRLQRHLVGVVNWRLKRQLRDAVLVAYSTTAARLFISCVFNFEEQLQDLVGGATPIKSWVNKEGRGLLEVAAKYGSCAVIDYLFKQDQQHIKITEEVVKVAARNYSSGKEVMMLLLDRRGNDVQITEEVVKAATGNYGCGKEVITLLLDRRGNDVQTTKIITKVALGKHKSAKDLMTLLLNRQEDNIQITEEILTSIVRRFDKEVMTLLLDRRGDDVQISEKVINAAADNQENGKEIMTLLLYRRGDDIQITEEIVISIARHFNKEVMTLLLDRRGDDVQITEKVLEAAACNRGGKAVIEFLLERDPSLLITEDIIKAAASNRGGKVTPAGKPVIEFLLERDPSLLITEEVVKAAACNRGGKLNPGGKAAIGFLLERDPSLSITEEVVKAAASNPGGKAVIEFLLERDPSPSITDEVVKAAAGNVGGKVVIEFLLERDPSLLITEKVFEVATCNRGGSAVLVFLLTRDALLSITRGKRSSNRGSVGNTACPVFRSGALSLRPYSTAQNLH
ncbi:hypothetical protein EV356DRAFT_135445 [Viridothelium virens]|uniref:NACHT domain-containing protein n=1 Tax=Viridothelium virens TaxID=1048519 RepID=A0A6A6HAB9_VIRVR|nr:hypothetical protein EV356DRAFT_135445 [Viridothelium virens]